MRCVPAATLGLLAFVLAGGCQQTPTTSAPITSPAGAEKEEGWWLKIVKPLPEEAPSSPFQERDVVLRAHREAVRAMAFSHDGKTLATGSDEKTIKLWDVKTGQERTTLKGQEGEVRAVVFAPDSKTLASGGRDLAVKLWDLNTGKVRFSFENFSGLTYGIDCSPDSKTLAYGTVYGDVRLCDVETGKPAVDAEGEEGISRVRPCRGILGGW
ncbi:MAG TPA: hypothetical protein VKI65_02245 [Gemmataceae bacterium]|nr:hypothetical protein [Gemmataceae bacterium]